MVNKRLKYILYFLMIISLFLTIKSKVHAQTTTGMIWSDLNTPYQGNNTNNNFEIIIPMPSNIKGKGAGVLNFVLSIEGKYKVYGISLQDNHANNCTFGDTMSYTDSGTQVLTYNITCPVNSVSSTSIYKIVVTGYCWNNIHYWATSPYISWSDFSDNTDYSTVLASLNTNIAEMGRYIQYTNTDVYAIRQDLHTLLTNINTSNQTLITNIQNQTQQQHQDSQNTQQKIDNIDNTLKDSSTDNQKAQDTFDNLNSNMATNSTISDLLLMPIHLLQKILNGLQGSCSAINTGQLFGEDFILPCINPSDVIGTALWNIIDVICSGFLAYHIGKRFVVIFNQFTNLKEGGLESAYD